MLLAMFTLVIFTFTIMLLLAVVRFRSVAKNDVSGQYYRLMKGSRAPDYVLKPARHFSNLFETPVLFYIAGTLIVIMDIQSSVAVTIAWVYVALRVVHAVIHLTYNHPIHRMVVFAVSTLCILALWVLLLANA